MKVSSESRTTDPTRDIQGLTARRDAHYAIVVERQTHYVEVVVLERA